MIQILFAEARYSVVPFSMMENQTPCVVSCRWLATARYHPSFRLASPKKAGTQMQTLRFLKYGKINIREGRRPSYTQIRKPDSWNA